MGPTSGGEATSGGKGKRKVVKKKSTPNVRILHTFFLAASFERAASADIVCCRSLGFEAIIINLVDKETKIIVEPFVFPILWASVNVRSTIYQKLKT